MGNLEAARKAITESYMNHHVDIGVERALVKAFRAYDEAEAKPECAMHVFKNCTFTNEPAPALRCGKCGKDLVPFEWGPCKLDKKGRLVRESLLCKACQEAKPEHTCGECMRYDGNSCDEGQYLAQGACIAFEPRKPAPAPKLEAGCEVTNDERETAIVQFVGRTIIFARDTMGTDRWWQKTNATVTKAAVPEAGDYVVTKGGGIGHIKRNSVEQGQIWVLQLFYPHIKQHHCVNCDRSEFTIIAKGKGA